MKASIVKTAIFLIVFSIGSPSYSQSPEIIWERSYGGTANDHSYDIVPTILGGYIVLGRTESNDGYVHGNKGNGDIWVLSLNAEGDTNWTQCYGGSENDGAGTLNRATDNGYIIDGNTFSFDGDVHGNHGESDIWILKIDDSGDTLWTKCLGGSGNEFGFLRRTLDNGYIIAGRSNSLDGDVHGNHGDYDCWVVKLNADGDTLWTKSLGGSEFDVAYAVNQTNDNGCIIAGYSYSDDGDVHGIHGLEADCWIIRLDASGDTLWTKCYGGSERDAPYSIIQTYDSGFIFAGYTESDDGDVHGHKASRDFWIVKLNSTGDTLWTKCLGSSDWDEAWSVIQTTDSCYIVAGEVSANDGDVQGFHGQRDAWFVKLNPSGDTLWTKCFGGSALDWPYAIYETAIDEYIVAGYSSSSDGDVEENNGVSDFWVVKLAPCPKLVTIDTTICEGDSYFAGGSEQTLPGTYYDTLQTYYACDSIVITNLSVEVCESAVAKRDFESISIYPVPVNSFLTIQTANFHYADLFDITGHLILSTKEKTLDLSELSEGIYFVVISDYQGNIETHKLILNK